MELPLSLPPPMLLVRPYRLPPALRLDALYCSGRCRKAAHRAEHAQRDAYRQERVGFRDGTAIRTVKRPHWSRRPAGAGANAVVRHRLLGACRITYVLGANHRESPCGRGAEGTTLGARPSEEGWNRSDCRCKAQAPWSYPAPRRFRDEYATDTRRLRDGYATDTRRFRDGCATQPRRLRACKPRNPAGQCSNKQSKV